ncbi:MAG: hypothetical protein JNM17_09515 [Archangium sp.]|nr:hypothetical protein [Archangium sp.]
MRPISLIILISGLAACGGSMSDIDGGSDAGRTDAGVRRDGGLNTDGGADAGASDAGGIDAGPRDAGPNHVPMVMPDILANRTTVYAGQVVDLALGVTDEDGDFLQFTWSGGGTFFENGNPSAQRWFSAETATPMTVTLNVSVTDGRSAPITRQIVINVTVPRFTDVYANILAVAPLQGGQCVGCHGTMGMFQIAGTRAGAYAQLVNAPHNRGAGCVNAGVPVMVTPGDVQRSLIYRKMTSTQPTACGDGMPAMSMVIPASPLQFIVTVGSWIRAGARDD